MIQNNKIILLNSPLFNFAKNIRTLGFQLPPAKLNKYAILLRTRFGHTDLNSLTDISNHWLSNVWFSRIPVKLNREKWNDFELDILCFHLSVTITVFVDVFSMSFCFVISFTPLNWTKWLDFSDVKRNNTDIVIVHQIISSLHFHIQDICIWNSLYSKQG